MRITMYVLHSIENPIIPKTSANARIFQPLIYTLAFWFYCSKFLPKPVGWLIFKRELRLQPNVKKYGFGHKLVHSTSTFFFFFKKNLNLRFFVFKLEKNVQWIEKGNFILFLVFLHKTGLTMPLMTSQFRNFTMSRHNISHTKIYLS